MPVLHSRVLGSEWGQFMCQDSIPDLSPAQSIGSWGGDHPGCPISFSRMTASILALWVVCLLRGSCAASHSLCALT